MTDNGVRALSPSGIRAFRRCPRAWAFRYIDDVDAGDSKFTGLGKDVHEVLENWLRDGVAPDPDTKEGKIAIPGLKYLPTPGSGLLVEEHVFYDRSDIIRYHGYVDLLELTLDIPCVTDHKTTVDFKWAKKEEDLAEDVQCAVYGSAALQRTGKDEVDLKWVYYRTRGKPKSKLVQLRLNKEQIEEAMEPIDDTALKIYAALEENVPAKDSPYNVNACDYFGGCRYKDRCNLSFSDRVRGIMAKQSLAEKMKADKAARKKAGKVSEDKPKDIKLSDSKPASPKINAPESGKAEGLAARMKKKKAAEAKENKPAAKTKTTKKKPITVTVSPSFRPETFDLFINCLPNEGGYSDTMYLHTIIGPLLAEINAHTGEPNYRMVEFGKGRGMLAAALNDYLSTNPIPGGTAVIISDRTDEGSVCAMTLMQYADMIVRGF